MIEADLQDANVDVGDPAVMAGRTWRWLRLRIENLLTRPFGYGPNGDPIFASRLQEHIYAPIVQARHAK